MHPFANKYPEIYRSLIDEETWSFIERTETFYPADSAEQSVEQQRSNYDQLCVAFRAALPDNVQWQDATLTSTVGALAVSVNCREYHPQSKVQENIAILYLHGGGFVMGSLESHHDICAEICARTGLAVVAIDYRLSPDYPHPAALEDTLVAYRSLRHDQYEGIILCGDSAGANLAAAASRQLSREGHTPVAQVLIYPGLGIDTTAGSFITHAHAPMLSTADVEYYKAIREPQGKAPKSAATADASQYPLCETDFSQLPPTVAIAAGCDPLADDARFYSQRIIDAGGNVIFREERGLPHGYLRARHSVARARRSFEFICKSLELLASLHTT